MITFKYEIYSGVHVPLITKELFDKTQMAFRKDNKPKHFEPQSFLLGGMLRCANCGCIVSGEMKKGGKYIYYSCTGAKGPCEQKHKYIREDVIEEQIIKAFEKIRIDEKQKEWIKLILAESFKDEQKYTKERLGSLTAPKNQLRNRIEQLYLDKIDGKISEDFWLSKHNEWSDTLIKIQNNITAYEKTNINYLDMCKRTLGLII